MTSQHGTRYLRYAALGDSTTVGIGDPVPGADGRQVNLDCASASQTVLAARTIASSAQGPRTVRLRRRAPRCRADRQRGQWRGWAKLLAESLATSYDVSFCNVAISGATTDIVREVQLADALAHRPQLASIVVGVNDSMRSTWDADRVRDDLLTIASRLDAIGATLVTLRFHDHGAMIGLPKWFSRPMGKRIDHVNAVYDEIHARWGGVQIDLARRAELHRKECWSIDRFHASEIGHRSLARAVAEQLLSRNYDFELPSLEPAGGLPASWKRDLGWMVAEGAPWMGRRAKDLGPWFARKAWAEVKRVPVG